ncbi:MAG TPA: cytochrome c3 family protein, partial [Kofleriaceae bacterium]|nr:cytochrome c3 family protein [Kofleriaceae bacterium]
MARDRSSRLLFALAALGVAALAVVTRVERARGDDPAATPSAAIFPEQRLPITFSHARHLARGGVTCVDCHVRAAASRSAMDRLTPDEAACRACHAIDRSQPARDDHP